MKHKENVICLERKLYIYELYIYTYICYKYVFERIKMKIKNLF